MVHTDNQSHLSVGQAEIQFPRQPVGHHHDRDQEAEAGDVDALLADLGHHNEPDWHGEDRRACAYRKILEVTT